jgi:DNA-nicking Smr family endonuclease
VASKHSLDDLKRLLDDKNKASQAAVAAKRAAPVVARESLNDHPSFTATFAPLKRTVELTDTEKKLFANAVADVAPLRARAHRPPQTRKPAPIPRQSIADEAAALQQANAATNPSPMSWDLGVDLEDDQSFLRTGANPDLLRKLRRGMWVVQGELDLHHHTQEEAHEALSIFLASAKHNEWRCVRIIHGKGLTSYRKEPVLRGKVRRWLQLRDDVMAYCEPKPNAGGSGAVLVMLNA